MSGHSDLDVAIKEKEDLANALLGQVALYNEAAQGLNIALATIGRLQRSNVCLAGQNRELLARNAYERQESAKASEECQVLSRRNDVLQAEVASLQRSQVYQRERIQELKKQVADAADEKVGFLNRIDANNLTYDYLLAEYKKLKKDLAPIASFCPPTFTASCSPFDPESGCYTLTMTQRFGRD